MSERELKNKPLVEAICEVRWALQHKVPGIAIDPHYRLLLGRLYDRLSNKYPEHEQLDTANMPDEVSGHVVQHRFRVAANGWPLVQVGPGVLTINDTSKYRWDDFRVRVLDVKKTLYESHPKASEMRVESLVLRYIDAVELDYTNSSVFDFLRDKLKINIQLPPNLFDSTEVNAVPQHYQSQQVFRCANPAGIIRLGLATGVRNSKPSLIWETGLHTEGGDLPTMPDGFEGWLDQSHVLVNDWFFKMINGELHRRFSGE
ncbi:MAG: TIGR04255 family protein [Planctomycetes bacterium]|nr:TIGR04255 family protein [Planctomycetota bacterium]